MPVQKAVASTVKTPGVFLTVNLAGGPQNVGSAIVRALLMAPKSSAGDLVNGTEVRKLFGGDDASTAFGPGTPGHLATKLFFARHPLGFLDAIAPAPSGGAAASETWTFSGTATENSTLRFTIHGREIDVPWNDTEVVGTFRTRAVATINEHAADLFVTASAGAGGGDVDVDAKIAGPWGNDVLLQCEIIEGGGGITISANPAVLAGGTTEPDFTTALATVVTRKYRRIIACCSNADATSASTSNPSRLEAQIDTLEIGLDAKLQVGVVGHTGSIANVETGAAARNNEAFEMPYGLNYQSLPCELAASEAGDALYWIATIRPNYNRIGNILPGLYGPKDPVADKLTATEIEDLLSNGVTPIDFNADTGDSFLVKPITTKSTTGGNPDYRAHHLSDTDGMYSVCEDLQVFLPEVYANASISPDLPAGGDPLPPGVVEERDVRGTVISRMQTWARLGVVERAALDASVAAGELTVAVDDGDPSQVNIFLPLSIIKPLAKFGVVGTKVQ